MQWTIKFVEMLQRIGFLLFQDIVDLGCWYNSHNATGNYIISYSGTHFNSFYVQLQPFLFFIQKEFRVNGKFSKRERERKSEIMFNVKEVLWRQAVSGSLRSLSRKRKQICLTMITYALTRTGADVIWLSCNVTHIRHPLAFFTSSWRVSNKHLSSSKSTSDLPVDVYDNYRLGFVPGFHMKP